MSASPRLDESTKDLNTLIETRLQRLSERIGRSYLLEETKADLESLSDLIYIYKIRDEMLEELLDLKTQDSRRTEILGALDDQRLGLAKTRTDVELLHA